MEKYLEAMDFGRRVIRVIIAEGKIGDAKEVAGRWAKFFDGIIEVAIYDHQLSQEEFAQLQACCEMGWNEYQEWRQNYGK